MAENIVVTDFDFSTAEPAAKSTFSGRAFYEAHKEDLFLQDLNNVQKLCSVTKQAMEARKATNADAIRCVGWQTTQGQEVVIMSGASNTITDTDFTFSRIQGLAAAFAYKHLQHLPDTFVVANAHAQGFRFKKGDPRAIKAYLSFVPGAEHFCHILGAWPIVATMFMVKNGKLRPEWCGRALNMKTDQGLVVNQLPTAQEIAAVYRSMSSGGALQTATVNNLIRTLFP